MFQAHQSANDIACILTMRETIMIGPPAAFSVTHGEIPVNGRGEIENVMSRVFRFPNFPDTLRKHTRQWGLDPSALKRLDDAGLRTWLSGQIERGALSIALVPDPAVSRGPHITGQELAMEQALRLRDRSNFDEDDEILPPDLESRFLILFDLLPDLLSHDLKKKIEELTDIVGLQELAAGFLIWLGPDEVPGLHLVIFGSNRHAASGDLQHALDSVRDCIEKLQKVGKRSEVEDIAPVMAEAVGILSMKGALSRLLTAKTIARGQASSKSGGIRKPG